MARLCALPSLPGRDPQPVCFQRRPAPRVRRSSTPVDQGLVLLPHRLRIHDVGRAQGSFHVVQEEEETDTRFTHEHHGVK